MKIAVLIGLILIAPAIVEATTDDGSYELVESTDLEKIFNTSDPKELELAQASLAVDGPADGQANYYDVMSYAGVLTCVRKIIEERRGGLQGTSVAAGLLDELTNIMFLQQRGSSLRLKCENYVTSTASERVDRDEQAQFITYLDGYDSRVKTMLYRYIKPTTTCLQIGGRIDVGLVAVVGGDVGLEYCSANNGRHWIQMALGGQGGYGAGAVAMFKAGNYRYRMNHLGGPFTYTKTRNSTWAVGFGMSKTDYGENYAHSTRGIIFVIPTRQRKSSALGLAYVKSWGRRAGLKFLPLGTRNNRLVSEYASLSDNDLVAEQATLPKELRNMGKAILRVNIDNDQQVTFVFCNADGNQCRDLAAGNSFPLSLLTENMESLQITYQDAKDRAFEATMRKMAGAGAALTVAAPMTVRTLLEHYSTEKGIPLKELAKKRHQEATDLSSSSRKPKLPYGFRYAEVGEKIIARGDEFIPADGLDGEKMLAEGGAKVKVIEARGGELLNEDASRGLKEFEKIENIQKRAQNVLDSSFGRKLHKTADDFIHGYSRIFKFGGTRAIIPVIAVIGGGAVALFASLDEHKNKQIVTKLEEIEDQRKEVARLLADPNGQVIIYDQRLMIETLKYLVN